ncbi:hypothetical protein LUZ60_008646 [Juncus effusus]|nr:hypothetical protein LUZ60_008646 [Juncus effusus]
MEYDPSDSSGTDDDLPPSYQNRNGGNNPRSSGPRVSGNGRSAAPGPSYSRSAAPPAAPGPSDSSMESQIHLLEQEAYCSVLRAFKAQADAITWEKEGLITELRKELRVSDKEHRELLSRVNADDIIRRIREWRQNGGRVGPALVQPGLDPVPSPTVSASRKRQKTGGATGMAAQSPAAFNPGSQQPSSSSAPKKGSVPPPFSKSKKPKPGQKMGAKTMQNNYSAAGPSGRGGAGGSRNSHAVLATDTLADVAAPAGGATAAPNLYDPLIGRKIRMRWPQDNEFYEAVITNFNPAEGLHEVVYDINTPNETWEWLNLKEISPEDIRWEGEEAGIIASQQRRAGGVKKSMGRGAGVGGPMMPGGGRGRGGPLKGLSKKEMVAPPGGVSLNGGVARRALGDDIEILHTETLIKEVERVFSAGHPDPVEIDKAKKLLKEHEQALIDAIAKLAEASDGESGGGNEQPMATDALIGVGPSDALI